MCGIVLAYPIWFAFAGPRHLLGPPHAPTNIARYAGDLAGVLLPTSNERFAPSQLVVAGNSLTSGDTAENGLYLGLPLLLILIGFTAVLRKRRIVALSAVMVLIAFGLSLGSRLTYGDHSTAIPLPWSIALHIPMLQVAIPARFSLYMQLFAAMILGIGLDSLRNRDITLAMGPDGLRRRSKLIMEKLHTQGRPGSTGQRRGLPWRWASGSLLSCPSFPAPTRPDLPPYPSFSLRQRSRSSPRKAPSSSIRTKTIRTFKACWLKRTQACDSRSTVVSPLFLAEEEELRTLLPYLKPPTLQTLFFYALHGTTTPFGPRPPLATNTPAEIRTLLVRYRVGTVVLEHVGVDPELAVQYLTMAIGQPAEIGGVTIWLNAYRERGPS